MDLLTIDLPDMPGYQLHHLGWSFTIEDGLAVIHNLGRKSPGLDALVELRSKYPKLDQQIPEVTAGIKRTGYSGLNVLSGLEEDYEWYGPGDGRFIGYFYSNLGYSRLHLDYRDDIRWYADSWLLSVSK